MTENHHDCIKISSRGHFVYVLGNVRSGKKFGPLLILDGLVLKNDIVVGGSL